MTNEWYVGAVAVVVLYTTFWIFQFFNYIVNWLEAHFPVFNSFVWLLSLVILWLIVMLVGVYHTYGKKTPE